MYLASYNERIRTCIILIGLFLWVNALAVAWQKEGVDSLCAQVQWGKRNSAEKGWDVVYGVQTNATRHHSQLLSRRLELGDSVQGGHVITDEHELTDGLPANLHFKVGTRNTTIADLPVHDFYVLSDISEIPIAQAVESFGKCIPPAPTVTLHLDSYFFDYGCKERPQTGKKRTFGTFLAKRSHLLKTCADQPVRECVEKLKTASPASPSILNAGYRLQYLTSDTIKRLVPSPLHQSFPELSRCMQLKCMHPVFRSIHGNRARPQRLSSVGPRKTAELIFKQSGPYEDLLSLYKPMIANTTLATCSKLARRMLESGYLPNATNSSKPSPKDVQDMASYSKALLRIGPKEEPPCYSCVYYIVLAVFLVIGILCSCFRC